MLRNLPLSFWHLQKRRLDTTHVVGILTFFTQQLLVFVVFSSALDATAFSADIGGMAFASQACCTI